MSRKRLVDELFSQVRERGMTMTDVCKKAGLSESTVRSWRRHEPLLGNLIALVEASGGTINLKWKEEDERILPRQRPSRIG